MQYLKQIYYEMKNQKMMTWVSISGTALAIFLVMSFFMTDQLSTVEVAPETHRSRMLFGGGIEYHTIDAMSSGPMSFPLINKIYGQLDGIEMSAVTNIWSEENASVTGKVPKSLKNIRTDANFWRLYDFSFISGRPFDESEIGTGTKKVIITRSVARDFFGKDDVTDEVIYLNTVPYVISGVVKDVNPSLTATFSNIYTPLDEYDIHPEDEIRGDLMVHLLCRPGVTEQSIKDQVLERYDRLNQEWAKDSMKAVYHGAPHNAEYLATGDIFSNITPDLTPKKRTRYILYVVLLLIPAINLSAMLRGRLRHRVSEIGVRRAFGAKKSDIVNQLLGENLIITFIGGAIGLAVSIVFMMFLSSFFIGLGHLSHSALKFVSNAPDIAMLFTWQSFAVALGICFLLNLMSAFVPSWKAARIQPAEAIHKSKI